MQLAGVPTWEESLSVRQGNIFVLGDTRQLEPATVLPFGEAVISSRAVATLGIPIMQMVALHSYRFNFFLSDCTVSGPATVHVVSHRPLTGRTWFDPRNLVCMRVRGN